MTTTFPVSAALRLENRHTGEVLEIRRERRDGSDSGVRCLRIAKGLGAPHDARVLQMQSPFVPERLGPLR